MQKLRMSLCRDIYSAEVEGIGHGRACPGEVRTVLIQWQGAKSAQAQLPVFTTVYFCFPYLLKLLPFHPGLILIVISGKSE